MDGFEKMGAISSRITIKHSVAENASEIDEKINTEKCKF